MNRPLMHERPTSFEQWQANVARQIRADALWNYVAYPKALFLFDLVWFDCERMQKDARGRALLEQLVTAAGSISANIEEGYGKGLGPDYARYLKIALGSTYETRGWYWRNRRLFSPKVIDHRLDLASEIVALLKTTISQQRNTKKK